MRLDQSSRRLAERARLGLVNVGAQIMGAVINDAPRSGSLAVEALPGLADVRPIVQRIAAGLAAEQGRNGDSNGAPSNGKMSPTTAGRLEKHNTDREFEITSVVGRAPVVTDEAAKWQEDLTDLEPRVS
jgi:hypothetical protein